VASFFDGTRQGSLVFGARARLPARPDLAILRHEAAQHIDFLEVDYGRMVCAKLANPWAGIKAPSGAWGGLVCHN
jgi:hypothetical protein